MPTAYRTGQKIDHYQIIRSLGRGIASHVYLAEDALTHRQVVLKFPTDDIVGGAAIYARFLREKEIGALLNHPGIQQHLNVHEERSQEYMVLEYLPGHTLREEMQKRAPERLSEARAVQILSSVCEALAYAHEQGVVHRDIKPDNIIMLENGEVKIIDFGIALLNEKRKRPRIGTSQLIGTPDYMPPERLLGEYGDVRADIYAVGITLYELMCGRTPFGETDGFDFVSEHFSHDPPAILQFAPTLSPALATVIMHAIRRDADERYASVKELLHDLCHLDAVKPIEYVPAKPKFGGRYRLLMYIAIILLVICLFLVAFGLLAQFAHTVGH